MLKSPHTACQKLMLQVKSVVITNIYSVFAAPVYFSEKGLVVLKCRLFCRICICQSRDMFDELQAWKSTLIEHFLENKWRCSGRSTHFLMKMSYWWFWSRYGSENILTKFWTIWPLPSRGQVGSNFQNA